MTEPTHDPMKHAMEEFQAKMARVTSNLKVMGVMGSLMRGEISQVQAGLKELTPELLQELSAASSTLASLAEEELTTRG